MRYLFLAAVSAVLAGCAASGDMHLRTEGTLPVHQEPPVSALRMYEAGVKDGRKSALDELRSRPIFANPVDLSVCPDKVSWLPRQLDIPEDIWIGSRKEDMELKKACRDGEIEKASIIRQQREAVESAE